jgi:hypothetical protein
MHISYHMYNALLKKYESEIASAKATLEIYFNNSVGIGEHPQHLEEMNKLVETMVSNEDKLSCLKKNFTNYSVQNINGNINISNVSVSSNIN